MTTTSTSLPSTDVAITAAVGIATSTSTASLPSTAASPETWEKRIADLLRDLSDVQGELLTLLESKHKSLRAVDAAGLNAANEREAELIARLQALHQRRSDLLVDAQTAQLPSDSLQAICGHLKSPARGPLVRELQEASRRTRLLQHQSLTNWVVVQRTLLHLSQMLEIIATGGRMQPTYGNTSESRGGGSLLNQEV